MKPNIDNIPDFYKGYVNSVIHLDYESALSEIYNDTIKILESISEEKSNYAYADNKWTIKDVVQHLIDSDRIFGYRAVAISRGEKQPIMGYDHNAYVDNAFANNRSFESLLKEFRNLHQSTKDLFNSFSPEMLKMTGNANGFDIKIIDLIYITAGHQKHHISVLKERYL